MGTRRASPLVLAAFVVLVGVAYRSRKGRGARPSQFVRWSDHDMGTFIEQVAPLGVPMDAVLQVYAAESGLDPKASSGPAWGLCQAIESTLKGAGWQRRPSEFGKLSVAQQAPWIARILASQIRMIGFVPTNALDLYVANFSPLAARNHSDKIYSAPSVNYQKNSGLDRAKKGYIDRADMAAALKRAEALPAYQTALEQLQRLTSARKVSNG